MASLAMQASNTTNAKPANKEGRQVVSTVPFIRASSLNTQYAGIDISRILTTSDQDLGTFEIPAFGYLRNVVILVTASGGTGGAPAVTFPEDSPFSTLKNIQLTEPNGAIIRQYTSGYGLQLDHKWGGYTHYGDMKASSASYVAPGATFTGYSYMARIPVELSQRDGLGSLPNQNAAATYKLRLTLSAVAGIAAGTLPTTLPTVRVQVFTESWEQPEMSTAGQNNQTTPPAMGTTAFLTEQIFNVNAGQQTIRLTRVGNYIRNLIMVYRRTAGTRVNGGADWPEQTQLLLDTRPIDTVHKTHLTQRMVERTSYGATVGATVPALDSPGGLDAGVFVWDFCHEFDGKIGHENRDLWLPTLGSTRLEIQGQFANAGTLTVYTNDVSITQSVFS